MGTKGILLVTGQLGPDPRRETVGQVRLWTILAQDRVVSDFTTETVV